MKKLLILIDKIGESTETLAEYVGNNLGGDSKLLLAKLSDLMFEIKGGELPKVWVDGVDIREFDIVYFRRVGHDYLSTAGTLALCLDKLGIKYFDTKFKDIGPSGDKFTALTKLFLGRISVPHTIFLWKGAIISSAGEILGRLGSPIIAKDYASQGNKQVFILRNKADFERLLPVKVKDRDAEFLFQEFVDIEREYRLLVMKDRVTVVHTKAVRDYSGLQVREDTPEDNLTFVDPGRIPQSLKEIAIHAAEILSVEIAGVDVALERGSGKAFVFEVNRGPGFLHDPKKSPELPELAKFFARELGSKNG